MSTGVDEKATEERSSASSTKGNSALAVLVAARSSLTRVRAVTSTPSQDTRTFRERFIASLEVKPVTTPPSSTPVSASSNATVMTPTDVPVMESKDPEPAPATPGPAVQTSVVVEHPTEDEAPASGPVAFEYDLSCLSSDAEESKDDAAEHNLKTLKDSRWAKDNSQDDKHSEYSRDSVSSRNDFKGPSRSQSCGEPEKRNQRKKGKWRNGSGRHRHKTQKNPRQTKEEDEETPREPPRLLMDMEEFERDVEKYNLKTLKDSRWA
ncbi:hypothetical protein F5Y01DRAFT_101628 [Xylaria sp. FL0043]|nr:hypothetical protein F5Y01DRAFT_101628 [Xylaria sp. FL0043]